MVARLTTGELAVVTRPGTEDTSRPWVRIARDADGNALDGEEVNLRQVDSHTKEYARSMLMEVDPTVYGINPVSHLEGKPTDPRHSTKADAGTADATATDDPSINFSKMCHHNWPRSARRSSKRMRRH
jgi:hypothetical protein